MKQLSLLIAGLAILASLAATPVQVQSPQTAALQPGTTVRVTLQKPLDSKRNKPGDPVIAKSTENMKAGGQDVVPRGSKILGHVTTVKSHTKAEPESALGIVFDHAVLKDGREVPLRLTIQAVAPGQDAGSPTMSMTPATAAGSGGAFGRRPIPTPGLPETPRARKPPWITCPHAVNLLPPAAGSCAWRAWRSFPKIRTWVP
jgi:hypothetical protein